MAADHRTHFPVDLDSAKRSPARILRVLLWPIAHSRSWHGPRHHQHARSSRCAIKEASFRLYFRQQWRQCIRKPMHVSVVLASCEAAWGTRAGFGRIGIAIHPFVFLHRRHRPTSQPLIPYVARRPMCGWSDNRPPHPCDGQPKNTWLASKQIPGA